MKIQEIVNAEVYSIDKTVTHNDEYQKATVTNMTVSGVLVKQIASDLTLWKTPKDEYFLKLNDDIVAYAITYKESIRGIYYTGIDVIYTFPEYRGKSFAKYLLYGIKEESKTNVIIDRAVFKDGQQLVKSLAAQQFVPVSVLDKETGEKTKFVDLINDLDKCYMFEQTRLGYFSNAGAGYKLWYNLFGEPEFKKCE